MFQKIALTAETEQQMKEAVKEFKKYFLKDGICKPIISNKMNNAKRQGNGKLKDKNTLKAEDNEEIVDLTLIPKENKATKYIDM
ncbi:hypothetical protein RMATCC62417_11748 [Rhizopus microsporus]|nr:hypothetical protein RMATCC62417_11748 [Rhizopus microsporus]